MDYNGLWWINYGFVCVDDPLIIYYDGLIIHAMMYSYWNHCRLQLNRQILAIFNDIMKLIKHRDVLPLIVFLLAFFPFSLGSTDTYFFVYDYPFGSKLIKIFKHNLIPVDLTRLKKYLSVCSFSLFIISLVFILSLKICMSSAN